ncbi:hypothetical protein ACOSP7_015121 [Xanthoceras sorbifolium]|uniref:protein-serine/threonine phosphatase n=1 Tax=Xanthoceras sorbifolium TaxID=99658 RepID=A0ABQ8GZ79_9ROSI|nr:hypothetical protein JRO89_XSUnG0196900 [Xanthoceras sorbifolium]
MILDGLENRMESLEEISTAVAVPFRFSNLVSSKEPTMEISGIRCLAHTTNLLSNSDVKSNRVYDESVSCEGDGHGSNNRDSIGMSKLVNENDQGSWNSIGSINREIREDDSMSIAGNSLLDGCSLEANSEINTTTISLDKKGTGDNVEVSVKSVSKQAKFELDVVGDQGNGTIVEGQHQKKICRTQNQRVARLDEIPRWGFTSVCGRRPEMEDAVAVVPRFLQIQSRMLMDDRVLNGTNQIPIPSHVDAHFFGVYDGHGGCQVANYCSKRMHSALIEEIESGKERLRDGNLGSNKEEQWKKAFTSCFLKVDGEIAGSGGGEEVVAPETVGSTAVVAIVLPTHIVVANCGDSRAVLCRGKLPMPLSVDHKPDREDEYARIEAAGGKVIRWNGSRVFGVLAMSRSIGDRYLKPWIIPDPDVMFVPRMKEDECLILASDGLWDVMTNEEACDVARKRILLWHKKHGDNSSLDRDGGVDPAAQAAADYLSKLAMHKGSKDNITVIVVDLKAQRKFKRKT